MPGEIPPVFVWLRKWWPILVAFVSLTFGGGAWATTVNSRIERLEGTASEQKEINKEMLRELRTLNQSVTRLVTLQEARDK